MTITQDQISTLVQAAIGAARNAYIPYSHYPVGAALRALDGTVFTGCNVENASYGATICAERTALVKAVSEGRRDFDLIAVVTNNGGSPCGICRQVLYEFAPGLRVINADMEGNILSDCRLDELLLNGFGPANLPR
jgi:cytidine deaminase